MSDFRLRVFAEVAKSLNFSKAAESLYITQPAVSKHIASLEGELGVQLFHRTRQGTALTAQGKIYAEYAEEILKTYAAAQFHMDGFSKKYGGTLKIGASTTVAQYFLPEILAKFSSKNPKIELSLLNANSEEVENLVLNNSIDLGFIEGFTGRPQLKYSEIAKDELVAVARPRHPLANLENITLVDALKFPWALRESGSGSLDILVSHLQQKGFSKKDILQGITLGSTESIKSYLKFSDCIGFVSIFSVKEELLHGKLKVLEIPNFEVRRTFYSAEAVGAVSGNAKLFLKFVRNNVR